MHCGGDGGRDSGDAWQYSYNGVICWVGIMAGIGISEDVWAGCELGLPPNPTLQLKK